MALGRSFLDQYSVFCVFGSVVGCVVVPLITQSLESLIFSAVVISITANRFSKKFVLEQGVTVSKEQQSKVKSNKEIPNKKRKKPPNTAHNNQTVYHQLSPSELRTRQREEIERRESEKLKEQERKEEEKREKKLKKKEERLKRKCIEKKAIEQKQQKITSLDKVTEARTTREPKKERSSSSSSYTNINTTQQQQRKTKYEHFRPNIPRFARMAAKQRQPPTTSPWVRSSPSPTDNLTPKVQSAIGSRKSEPSSPQRDTPSPSSSSVSVEEISHKGCYTLFGESEETKTLVSLIRMEAGLDM